MTTMNPSRRRNRHRGIALVLVVMVMALAAILGYAMLSGSAVQATASSNAVAAATARAQAESGIHYAMYYLMNDTLPAPGITWSNVTFSTVHPAATIPGNVTIVVGPIVNHCCSVVATGSSGASEGGGAVTRTITAEVLVGTPLQINEAGAFDGNVTVGSTFSFKSTAANVPAVSSTSTVTNNGAISGNISAASVNGSGTHTGGTNITAPSLSPAPSSSGNVTDFTQKYIYQGVVCTPVLISATVSSNTSLAPTPSNPLGIYYTAGNLGISTGKTLTVNGTLVVQGTMNNTGSVSITPVSPTASTNMPALVVDNKLTITGASRSLIANGVVYVAGGITGSGATGTSTIQINGALLVTSNAVSGYSGAMSVTYNSASTNIPNFDVTDWNPTAGIKIISWSE